MSIQHFSGDLYETIILMVKSYTQDEGNMIVITSHGVLSGIISHPLPVGHCNTNSSPSRLIGSIEIACSEREKISCTDNFSI